MKTKRNPSSINSLIGIAVYVFLAQYAAKSLFKFIEMLALCVGWILLNDWINLP